MIAVVRKHPLAASVLTLAAAGAAVVLFWFQPQKLYIDDRVNESLPRVSAEDGAKDVPASLVKVLAEGDFLPLDHDARGTAKLIEIADGRTFVRFEDFEVENGPDLKVYLSTATADSDEDALVEDFVDLGGLKGNIGNQNYAVEPSVDVGRFRSVVVWCRRFSVGFAVAPLER